MYIIGIDLASQKSGIVLIKINKDRENDVYYFDIKMKPFFKYKNLLDYCANLKIKLNNSFYFRKNDLIDNCIIVIEDNTRHNTLSKVCGMWIAILQNILQPLHLQLETPNSWYSKLKLGPTSDNSKTRKAKARELFFKDCDWLEQFGDKISEDICDAYCIAKSWLNEENNV